MSIVSVAEVRVASGLPTSLMSNSDVQIAIDGVETDVARYMNTSWTPKLQIDFIDGSPSGRFFTKKNPLLQVLAFKNHGNNVTPSDLTIYRESGKVQLREDASIISTDSSFISGTQSNVIKYYFGMIIQSTTQTASLAAVEVGTSVAISVASETGFSVGDWIDIIGMDGKRESTQVTATGSGSITVNQLVFDHESGSLIYKMEVPGYVKELIKVESAIAINMNAIGATFTFNASYNLSELGVVKGVPHIHWSSSVEKLIKKRDRLMGMIKPRMSIV